ncbi:MAG TPA: ABC transporter ATP-binding protein [Allosphingosinicella sp.]|jgi:iron complex transport system ATP-binding protein|uniref:ABC transporter ATP-binding protein n=1 Tax=Allosphingosinicella sp. TaxID=2823234 RepID=UPI002F27CBEF
MSAVLAAKGLALPGRLTATNISLDAGELCCLVGPNGSGKTSLLHAIAGVGRPSGKVLIDGNDPQGVGPADRQRLLSYLPASRDIAWPLVASDLIRLGSDLRDEEIEPMVEALGLEELLHRRTDRLSTGERSRVLIARALAPRPRLLLLDEPVSNLDPLWQLKLLELIRNEARDNGQAVLLAIHDLDLAVRYANRLIVMAGGCLAADGAPDCLLGGSTIHEVFGIRRSAEGWSPA